MKFKKIVVTALVSVLALGNVMIFTQKSSAAVEETSLASILNVNEAFAEKTTKTTTTKTKVRNYELEADVNYGVGHAKVDIQHKDSITTKEETWDDGRPAPSDSTYIKPDSIYIKPDSTYIGGPNN